LIGHCFKKGNLAFEQNCERQEIGDWKFGNLKSGIGRLFYFRHVAISHRRTATNGGYGIFYFALYPALIQLIFQLRQF